MWDGCCLVDGRALLPDPLDPTDVFQNVEREKYMPLTIQLTGLYAPLQMPWFQARKTGTMQDVYRDAHCVRKHKNGYHEQDGDRHEFADRVEETYQRCNLYERVAKSIAPEIFGHVDVKKALLMALVGSFAKTMKDGMANRGDIHILLMVDPGVAESQLLRQACKIAPRSVYTIG